MKAGRLFSMATRLKFPLSKILRLSEKRASIGRLKSLSSNRLDRVEETITKVCELLAVILRKRGGAIVILVVSYRDSGS